MDVRSCNNTFAFLPYSCLKYDYVLEIQDARNEVGVCGSLHPYLDGMLPRKRTRSDRRKYAHACKDVINLSSQLIRSGSATEYYAYDCMD